MSVAVQCPATQPQPPVTALACGPCWERKHQRVPAFRLIGATPMCQTCYAGGNEPDAPVQGDELFSIIDERLDKLQELSSRIESKFLDIAADLAVLADRQVSVSLPSTKEVRIRMADICTAVSRRTGIATNLMRCKANTAPIARSRHLAMAIAREYGYSYPQIGSAFGGRHHTTVIYAVEKIRKQEQTNKQTRLLLLALRQDLQNGIK